MGTGSLPDDEVIGFVSEILGKIDFPHSFSICITNKLRVPTCQQITSLLESTEKLYNQW